MSAGPGPTAAPAHQVRLVVVTVFLAYTAQMVMSPLIAPLSRELGLAEWQVGLVVSVAALCLAVASPLWGRASQTLGPKRVLTWTLASCALAMGVFAAITQVAISGSLPALVVFLSFLLVRGLWFGLSEAAILPTAQAYVASVTPSRDERVRGMSAIGAAAGASLIVGAALGGIFGGLSVMLPLWAVPVMLAATLATVVVRLRPAAPVDSPEPPRTVTFTDSRIWPFLVVSFGLYTALGFIQILIGFLVQDRLGLGLERTTLVAGLALLCAGFGLVLSQAVAVPRLSWSPVRYIRVGAAVALAGFALLVPDLGAAGLMVAILLTGFGLGMATPGFTAGASLAVEGAEQGSIAGLVASTNAVTFIVAPALATTLYASSPAAPLVVAAVITALVVGFALTHRTFRTRVPVGAAEQG